MAKHSRTQADMGRGKVGSSYHSIRGIDVRRKGNPETKKESHRAKHSRTQADMERGKVGSSLHRSTMSAA